MNRKVFGRGVVGCAAMWLAACGSQDSNEPVPAGTADAVATNECAPSGSLEYICGPKNAEDILAILADGGFVTTKMMDPTVPNGFAAIMTGQISGNVFEWHPGGQVTAVPGTELAGANGIELSPDERWMYVAAFGTREVVRFDRQASPVAKTAVELDITPDNLRWTEDGKLYTAGGNQAPAECASPPCPAGWSVIEVDPETLQTRRIAGVDQHAALQGASAALSVGDRIWIGTYSGDRIGILPKP